ncbi:MAG: hypothetical protein GY882_11655 [Actinomycetia bacterium]|nr:hypothetical protein [Actinomycetes bacterium]MCP4845753.1 hypothetical protein [Actinomycetes bacterium]
MMSNTLLPVMQYLGRTEIDEIIAFRVSDNGRLYQNGDLLITECNGYQQFLSRNLGLASACRHNLPLAVEGLDSGTWEDVTCSLGALISNTHCHATI